MLVVLAIALLVLIVCADIRQERLYGAGEEHRFTATAACMNGHHHNCSGNVHHLFKREVNPCTCPHHKEER